MTTEMRERSLQSSILFMQQEHANTLKALHEEIEHLQKKCSDLTFQLAMEATTTKEDEDKERIKDLEKQLQEAKIQTQMSTDEREALSKKNEKIRILENQLKAQEMKYLNELKAKNLTIAQLKSELEQKAATVAELANKLRSMHKGMAARKAGSDSSVVSQEGLSKVPTPPREEKGPHHRRSSASRRSSKVVLSHEVIPRPPSSRRLSANEDSSRESIPDPTPFLNRRHSQDFALRRSSATPLPPISLREKSQDEVDTSPLALKYGARKKAESLSASPSPEVQVLAVDAVSQKHRSIPRTQQYQRDFQGT